MGLVGEAMHSFVEVRQEKGAPRMGLVGEEHAVKRLKLLDHSYGSITIKVLAKEVYKKLCVLSNRDSI